MLKRKIQVVGDKVADKRQGRAVVMAALAIAGPDAMAALFGSGGACPLCRERGRERHFASGDGLRSHVENYHGGKP